MQTWHMAACDRREGRENVQKDWVGGQGSRLIPLLNGWSDMERPSAVNGSLVAWHGTTKDNSTNAEERPAVDHETKHLVEVRNALMLWILTFVVPAYNVIPCLPWKQSRLWLSTFFNSETRPVKFVSEAVLEQNPKFRAIHSGASVQKVIEKV